jgi:hypothetical protein
MRRVADPQATPCRKLSGSATVGRLQIGTVAGFISERWPASNRYAWPECVGIRRAIVCRREFWTTLPALKGAAVQRPPLRFCACRPSGQTVITAMILKSSSTMMIWSL